MITSVLLCYMGEEDAFWMLSYIVEYLLPDYYTSGLFGLIIDQRGEHADLKLFQLGFADCLFVSV
jgi:hypothetical protein